MSLAIAVASAAAARAVVFTQVPGSPFAMPSYAGRIEFSPNGRLFVVGEDGTNTSGVTLFSVSRSGVLRRLPGSLFAHTSSYSVGAVSPNGKFLVVWIGIESRRPRLTLFSIGRNGLGKRHGTRVVPGAPWGVGTFSPDGRLLAVPTEGGGKLSMFSVGPSGSLTPVAGSPFHFDNSNGLAFDPNGRFLVSVNELTNKLDMYGVGPTGVLSSAPVASIRSGSDIRDVAFSPFGNLVAAPNYGFGGWGAVWTFTVSSGGTLTKVRGAPVSTRPGGYLEGVTFSPDGKLLAADSGIGHTLAVVFAVGKNGVLHRVATLSSARSTSGVGPFDITFSPNSKLLALVNQSDGSVAVFARR